MAVIGNYITMYQPGPYDQQHKKHDTNDHGALVKPWDVRIVRHAGELYPIVSYVQKRTVCYRLPDCTLDGCPRSCLFPVTNQQEVLHP